ncbi:MAG: MFS transporter, partial [Actinobacteria bacterium]|nr:MFS transporter [Actinomycetota bacterium]
ATYITANGGSGKVAQFAALTHGYTQSFKVGAAFLLIGAVVLAFTIKIGKDSLVETDLMPAVH